MSAPTAIREGQILNGPQFSEPMLVETVRSDGPGIWVAGLVGRRSERFRRVTLTADDIAGLIIADPSLSYDGDEIGRITEELDSEVAGAEGRLAQAEARHADVLARRERRREELGRQRAVTLQGIERLASALILPHPEPETLDVRRLRPHPETEMTAMRVVMDHEAARGCKVYDVHEQNLGYDVTSLDLQSGELRLIEVKGLAGPTGSILLTPNERRVAEDRRDCYWLYVVTACASAPNLQQPIPDPARYPWHEVTKVAHYYLSVNALQQPMEIRETERGYNAEAKP